MLVENDGFTTGARAMNLSQAAFSARIFRLEKALGVTLVDRSVRRLTLTREGRAFQPLARSLLACCSVPSPTASTPPGAGVRVHAIRRDEARRSGPAVDQGGDGPAELGHLVDEVDAVDPGQALGGQVADPELREAGGVRLGRRTGRS